MTPVRAPVDLRTLPAIRAEAERLANDSWACCRVALRRVFGLHAAIEMPSREVRDAAIEAHLDLLTDLTRPASTDAVARLVAAKVPGLQAWEVVAGCECGGARLSMVLRYCGMPEIDRWEPDPSPAEALRLIATHVLRSPHV